MIRRSPGEEGGRTQPLLILIRSVTQRFGIPPERIV